MQVLQTGAWSACELPGHSWCDSWVLPYLESAIIVGIVIAGFGFFIRWALNEGRKDR